MRPARILAASAALLLNVPRPTAGQEAPAAPQDAPPPIGQVAAFADLMFEDAVAGFPRARGLAGEPGPNGVRLMDASPATLGFPARLVPPGGGRGERLELILGLADSEEARGPLLETYELLRVDFIHENRRREVEGDGATWVPDMHIGRGSSQTYPMSWKGQLCTWTRSVAGGFVALVLEVDDAGEELTLGLERVKRHAPVPPDPTAPLFERAEELAASGHTIRALRDTDELFQSDERFMRQYELCVLPATSAAALVRLIADDAANGFTALRAQPLHASAGTGWKYDWTIPCPTVYGHDLIVTPHWPLRFAVEGCEGHACWSQVSVEVRDERASCLLWLPDEGFDVASATGTVTGGLGEGWRRVEGGDEEPEVIEWTRADGAVVRLWTELVQFVPRFARVGGKGYALQVVGPEVLPLREVPLRPIAMMAVRNDATGPLRISDYLNVPYEGYVWPNEDRQLRTGTDILVAVEGVPVEGLTDGEVLALFEGEGETVALTVENGGARREVRAHRPPRLDAGDFERALEGELDLSPSVALALLDARRFPALVDEWLAAAGESFAPLGGPLEGARGERALPANLLGGGGSTSWQRLRWNEDYAWIELELTPQGPSAFEMAQQRWSPEDHDALFAGRALVEWMAQLLPQEQWALEETEERYFWTRRGERLLGPELTLWRAEARLELRAPRPEQRERIRADPSVARARCVSGDCADGYGRRLEHARRGEYEGFFQDGLYHGVGRSVVRGGEICVGTWKGGHRHGPATRVYPEGRVIYDTASRRNVLFATRWLYEEGLHAGSVETDVMYPWGATPELKQRFRAARAGGGSDIGYEHGPWLARRGRVLEGDAQGGRAKVELPGTGVYEGRFVNGAAEGRGLLRRSDGSLYLMDCAGGIPSLQRVLVPPDELLWEAYQADVTLLRVGDCIRGDCWNGTGTMLMNWWGVYIGEFERNEPNGQGELWEGQLGRGGKHVGSFTNGRKNGRFTVHPAMQPLPEGNETRWVAGGPPETRWYRDDQRVTESGEDYYAALERERAERRAAANEPEPRASSAMTIVCSACRGTGWYDHPGQLVDEWTTTPFMPGDRNYGSWLWSGYAHKTGRQVYAGGYSGPCSTCNGDGLIRVDQPLGSPLR